MPVFSGTAQDIINPAPARRGWVKICRLQTEDRNSILHLLEKTPQFTYEERQCALELVDLYIKQGEQSGYDFFISKDADDKFLGYICFGKIPLTDACYDIYWIVINTERQNNGVGALLMGAVEEKLRNLGARKIFVETSSQKSYTSANSFYQKMDFRLISCIKNFYKIGDDKLVYVKEIERR